MFAGAFLCAAPIFAHHGYAAYDMQITKTLKGTITEYMMANPHSQIGVDVKDDSGNVEHWVVEDAATVRAMKEEGWEVDSLKPGDAVTIIYHPAKGPGHAGLLIRLEFPDGRTLPKPRANNPG
jgi:hypothetical protein